MNGGSFMNVPEPMTLVFVFGVLALLPTVVVCTTAFLKISIVMSLVRNALGVQQIPPTVALYGLSLILAAYIMAPIGHRMQQVLAEEPNAMKTPAAFIAAARKGAEPLREFMIRHSRPDQREFFAQQAKQLWGPELSADVTPSDFLIVLPAFMVSEMTAAFEIGFLIFLPFLIVDLVISNILLAMGMMMVSPVTISLPLKLFLFVAVDGWSRLIHGLVLTYT